MKITPLGAAGGEVTGSCYSGQTRHARILVDIARRLRAMIVNLDNTLPAERHATLRQELKRLDQTLEKLHVLPEDLVLARIPDSQGLSGSTDPTLTRWAA